MDVLCCIFVKLLLVLLLSLVDVELDANVAAVDVDGEDDAAVVSANPDGVTILLGV